jgi:hypothetical protein
MNLFDRRVIEKKWKGENKPSMKRHQKAFGRFLLKDFNFFNGGFGVD